MRCVLSLLFLSNIAHDHTTLSSVAAKFGRGKMVENPLACVQQFRDGMELGGGCMLPLVSLLFRDVCDP